jgi:hypothetical protein
MQNLPLSISDKIKTELAVLDSEMVNIEGENLTPSQCYHFDTNPPHLLFNTNCPDSLREKLKTIIAKYIPSYEAGS